MVGARGRMVSSEQPLDGEQGAILVFDKQFSFLSKLQPSEFRLRDIHEITWNDDCLWVTCSYDNMIAIWNGSRWEKWYPLGATIREPSDQNHFNSLFFEDNSFWIIAHNNGPSELLQFKRGSRQLRSRISLGNQAHNLWRENGSLYTCSSGESAIVGTDGFRLETGGFPRGVAFGHGMRCIGISELAERRFRDLTTARIAIFDDKWNRLSDIELPNEGLILDIKLQSELSN
jgi:WD40 repeat protein